MKVKYLVGLVVISLWAGSFWAQEGKKPDEKPAADTTAKSPATPQGPHVFEITSEDAARKNPVTFTEVSVARGKKIYATQCAMCHGEKGDGKGDIVEEMGINPPDFTKPGALKKRSDGELFAIIGVGSPVMPGQAKRLSDRHRWQIVNYLRSLGGEKPEKATGKEPEENVILVPQ
ncbi:MAG: cytochrome c [Acidobacteria bacterium]|nr:cytochrome c [Acidobacteriota bacterium]